ncbi:hypothetical protein CRUP_002839 [Coryphaenoides rupestris]|nr:hypothetical protein CRUP_002839 [Coryphaenoides rupestris]
MSRHDDTLERLNADFEGYLEDMKPYVLKHPSRTERQRCAVWIRKLCDPVMCGSGPVGLKNRNMTRCRSSLIGWQESSVVTMETTPGC